MSKNLIYLFLVLFSSILFLIKAEVQNSNNGNVYTEQNENEAFKETLKQYLIDKKLIDSEEPVKPEEMKKIFLEVITEGDAESSAEYFGGIFDELADYFVNTYYVNRKEVKGKDIINLINIEHIADKFEQMIGNYQQFNEMNDNEENSDYDTRDDVGEANPDI